MVLGIAAIAQKKNMKNFGRTEDGVQERVTEIAPTAKFSAFLGRVRLTNLVLGHDSRCTDPDQPTSMEHVNFAWTSWHTEPPDLAESQLNFASLRRLRPNCTLDGDIVDACLGHIRKNMDSSMCLLPVHTMASIKTDAARHGGDYSIAIKGLNRYLPDPTKDARVRQVFVPVCDPTHIGHFYFFVVHLYQGEFEFPFDAYNSFPSYKSSIEWTPAAASERLQKFLIHFGYTQGPDNSDIAVRGERIRPANQDKATDCFSASSLHTRFYFVLFCGLLLLVLVFCFETHTHNPHRGRCSSSHHEPGT